jgi:uncharacterized surface protein with fasciclin (FAS1) repeats
MGVTASKAQRARRALAGVIAGFATVTVAVTAAACGSSNTVAATPTGGAAPYSGQPSASPQATAGTAARIGHDCGLIPAKGEGSISQIGTERAITAASRNPQLSVFVAAVRTAGLDKTLNSGRASTLMVPVNSAFASLSRTQIVHLHNSGDLFNIVRYHAIHARVSPQQFASGARPVTLLGKQLSLSKSGSVYKVNGATVLCGNIKTANATVYIVSKVLLPPG